MMSVYAARKYRPGHDPCLQMLLTAHMRQDDSWPSQWVREQGDLLQWLRDTAGYGRWVCENEHDIVLAHVCVHQVSEGHKAEQWTALLGCETSDLAEIGKLLVHPDHRRRGISAVVTRYCVRQTIELGKIPVATAYADNETASIDMMAKLGWQIIGRSHATRSRRPIVLLSPPQQLVTAALTKKHTLRRKQSGC